MKRKGFTLIELMVVIAIIGLLAAIALPRFAGVSDSAKVANVQGNLSSMRTSIAMFHAKADMYPTVAQFASTDVNGPDLDAVNGTAAGNADVKFTQFYGKSRLSKTPAYKGTVTVVETAKVTASTVTGNSITGDGTGGWLYRESDGAVRANLGNGTADKPAYDDTTNWSEF